MNYTSLIVAAGSGERVGLGYNKLLYRLSNQKTIIEQTVDIFLQDERCQQVVLVVSQKDEAIMKELFPNKKICITLGGDTRQASVFQGLQQVKQEYVLIHDGARAWLTMDCIDRILDCLRLHKACLLCVDVKDTIKEVIDQKVVHTPQRSHLKQAQTPQAFQTTYIKECYKKAMQNHIVATDDAQIAELCGDEDVIVVEGSYENKKLTTIEDLPSRK